MGAVEEWKTLPGLGADPPRMQGDGQNDLLTYAPVSPLHVCTRISL